MFNPFPKIPEISFLTSFAKNPKVQNLEKKNPPKKSKYRKTTSGSRVEPGQDSWPRSEKIINLVMDQGKKSFEFADRSVSKPGDPLIPRTKIDFDSTFKIYVVLTELLAKQK